MPKTFAVLTSSELISLFCLADLYGFKPSNLNWMADVQSVEQDGSFFPGFWWLFPGQGFFLLSESRAFFTSMSRVLKDGGSLFYEAKRTLEESEQLEYLQRMDVLPLTLIQDLVRSESNMVLEFPILDENKYHLMGYLSTPHREARLEKAIQLVARMGPPRFLPEPTENVLGFVWHVSIFGYPHQPAPTPMSDILQSISNVDPGCDESRFRMPVERFTGILAIADSYDFKPEKNPMWTGWPIYYYSFRPEEPYRWWNSSFVKITHFEGEEYNSFLKSIMNAIEDKMLRTHQLIAAQKPSVHRRQRREAISLISVQMLEEFVDYLGSSTSISWKFSQGPDACFYVS